MGVQLHSVSNATPCILLPELPYNYSFNYQSRPLARGEIEYDDHNT
jgi:hypothetical protein